MIDITSLSVKSFFLYPTRLSQPAARQTLLPLVRPITFFKLALADFNC